nr:MAG TPA: hypothetical protein [Caudoviricetes sp.]
MCNTVNFVTHKAFYPYVLIVSYKFGVHFQPKGCRALLEGLYLFTLYALRCSLAFRNLKTYLGISIHYL